MDNLTHSLTGLALARSGLDRYCPRAALLMIVAANIPDADAVSLLGGQLRYLEIHRGYSHSLIALPITAIIPVLLIAGIYRTRLPWIRAWVLSCIAVASHLVLDWSNSYGIRLLLPFTSNWYHLDLNGFWDGVLLTVLAFSAGWPILGNLVSHEIGDRGFAAKRSQGQTAAVLAVAFFLTYDGGKAVLHQMVVAKLESRLYDGDTPKQAAALPHAINPLAWQGIVETNRSFKVFSVNALSDFDPAGGETIYKLEQTAAIQNARKTAPFTFFSYFARFPVWLSGPISGNPGEAKRIELTDLRFGIPNPQLALTGTGASSFRVIAIEDARDRVLRAWLVF